MKLIREIAKQALNTGYLTIEAEEKLRGMLKNKYDVEDWEAFMNIQRAAMIGMVRQESKEIFAASRNYF